MMESGRLNLNYDWALDALGGLMMAGFMATGIGLIFDGFLLGKDIM